MLDKNSAIILLAIFLSNCIYGLAAPFLPKLLEDKGIAQSWTGIIFGAFAFSQIFFALICGKIVDRVGHKQIMVVGAFGMSAAIAAFSFAIYLDAKWQIIGLGILLRALQGAASGLINTAAYSYVAQAYASDVEKMIAMIETIAGLGASCGPLLGSIVFETLGFAWTFIIFGVGMTPCCILLILLAKPSELKQKLEDKAAEGLRVPEEGVEHILLEDDNEDVEVEKLSYGKLLCTRRIFFAAITAMVGYSSYCAFEPTLSLRLEDYGLNQIYQGVIFTVMPFSYVLGTLVSSCAIPKWIEIRCTLITGSLLCGLSILLIGPVFEEQSLPSMIAGLILLGIFLGPIIIPNMAEMMFATKRKFPTADLEQANSLLSGIINSFLGLGMAIGPIIGSSLYQALGFRMMSNIVAGIIIFSGIAYFICCNGCEAFSSTCKNYGLRNRKLSMLEQLTDQACYIRHSSIFMQSIVSKGRQRAMSTFSAMSKKRGMSSNQSEAMLQQQYGGMTQSQRQNYKNSLLKEVDDKDNDEFDPEYPEARNLSLNDLKD